MRTRNYEDVRAQAERLEVAVAGLQAALYDLATEAKAQSKRKTPDVPRVKGLVGAVERAEEALDIATLDLETARGADA